MTYIHHCRFCGKEIKLEIPAFDTKDNYQFPVRKSLMAIARMVCCERCCKYQIARNSIVKGVGIVVMSWPWVKANPKSSIGEFKLKVAKLAERYVKNLDEYLDTDHFHHGAASDLFRACEEDFSLSMKYFEAFEKSITQ